MLRSESNAVVLNARFEELFDEIKIRLRNNANEDVTFDKVIESFSTLNQLSLISFSGQDDFNRLYQRRELFKKLFFLLDIVKEFWRKKPLYGEMVKFGFKLLNDFNYYELRDKLKVYYWVKRKYPEFIEGKGQFYKYHIDIEFSNEELDAFSLEKRHLIDDALAKEIFPRSGYFLQFPFKENGAQDFWELYNALLKYSTGEKEVQPIVELLPDRN
ncbi:hypothetical protein [Janthinobacterium sp. LB3P112]|uniref:hypothetical protein n=1 Tax=Janthinobacterium sp. LB3P112 TaxID=3424196 RepID=UPI003F278BE4